MKGGARVEIDVGELVLDGVAPAHRREVAQALERELAAGVARHGCGALLASSATTGRQVPPAVTLPAGATPKQIGVAVARSIARSWR
jgi:hypothetical protein